MSRSTVYGFVEEVRNLGNLIFLKVFTKDGYVQVTVKKGESPKEIVGLVAGLTRQSAIRVTGELKANPAVRVGLEMIPEELEVVSMAEEPLPLDPSGKTPAELETRLNWRSLDLRSSRNRAIFKVQSRIVKAFTDYLTEKDFTQVFTPSLLGVASEGGADVFELKYFKKNAYLRQDPQLHRDLTVLGGLERIFEIGPSWRAELSHTKRHMCEHRVCAVEFANIKDESDVIAVEEDLVKYTMKKIMSECKTDLELLGASIEVPKTPFPVLRFQELYEILKKLGKSIPKGEEYDRESEELLGNYVKKEYGSDFFFVDGFPFSVKPFYVTKFEKDPLWARSVDMIFRGIEISTGGQREHRYEILKRQAEEKKLSPRSVDWFIKFFKYGAPTLGGFSIGIERFTMQLLGIQNVREVTLFPRTPERLVP